MPDAGPLFRGGCFQLPVRMPPEQTCPYWKIMQYFRRAVKTCAAHKLGKHADGVEEGRRADARGLFGQTTGSCLLFQEPRGQDRGKGGGGGGGGQNLQKRGRAPVGPGEPDLGGRPWRFPFNPGKMGSGRGGAEGADKGLTSSAPLT